MTKKHKVVCVVQINKPYNFLMQPIDISMKADEPTDGILFVYYLDDSRTRVCENGIKYGVKYVVRNKQNKIDFF